MKKLQTLFMVFGALLIVTAATKAIVDRRPPSSDKMRIPHPTGIITIPTTPDSETAGWKTYANSQYSLRYPTNWECKETIMGPDEILCNQKPYSTGKEIQIDTSGYTDEESALKVAIYDSKYSKFWRGPFSYSKVEIAGATGFYRNPVKGVCPTSCGINIFHNNMGWNIPLMLPLDEEVAKILGTLHFLQ